VSRPATASAATGAPPVARSAGAIRSTVVAALPYVAQAWLTRRRLQVALGLLWLLDGALQLQPFMLRASFAGEVLGPAGDGQPRIVAVPVHWAAHLVAAHPAAWDVPFATVQLLIGLGMLVPRTARLALAASIPWVVGVWFFGEGLSGLASGNASLLSGAPGAVLLYGVLALAAWPRDRRSDVPPAQWLPFAWAAYWVGGAVLQVLPKNNSGDAVADVLRDGWPSWLPGSTTSITSWVAAHGLAVIVVLVATEALIGLTVFDQNTSRASAVAGLALSLLLWVGAQNVGELATGQSTDPNSAPLVILTALALLASQGQRSTVGSAVARRDDRDAPPLR